MEASALTHASRRGLLARRSPVLKLEKDERLVALIRSGHDRAFEVLVDRYQSRLLAFCASMLKSRQDAEDVLQEVFVNAHNAMLADERKINVRPWLYRIARNRCLNHLRKVVPQGQDSMDIHPHLNGTTTAERVQNREDLREVLNDVGTLPETQRTALLLREIDQMSYEEIAVAMDTTIPAVKSLLVRARIMLAESSQARTLSCDEVRVSLAEAAEGIAKAGGPVRIHVKNCEGCADFRSQLRADRKALAAILPIGPLAFLKGGLLAKLFGGGGGATAGGATAGGAASTSAIGAAAGTAAAGGTATATAGGIGGAIGGAIGTKAVASVATAAILTAGAVEVSQIVPTDSGPAPAIGRADNNGPSKGPDGEKRFTRKLLVAAAGAGVATATAEPEQAAAEEPAVEETEGQANAEDGAAEGEPAERESSVTAEVDEGDEVSIEDDTGREAEPDGGVVTGPIVGPEPDPRPPSDPTIPPPGEGPRPPAEDPGGDPGDPGSGSDSGEDPGEGSEVEGGVGDDPLARPEDEEPDESASEADSVSD